MQYDGYQVSLLGAFATQDRSKSLGTQVLRQGPVTLNRPLLAPGVATAINRITHNKNRTDSGYLVPSFAGQFYNRIAVIPASMSLGSISSDQVLTVQVWNAWLKAQTLLSVTMTGSDGITLTGPETPRKFNRLAIFPWQIVVSMTGPDEIYCVITWHFAGLDPVRFVLTGRRSAPWLLTPDWTDGITETLEWKTDVLTSQTGAEQRIARRLSPRRTFEFKVVAQGTDRQRLESAIYHYGARSWALPIYPDVSLLTAAVLAGSDSIPLVTSGKDFVAGGVALICANSDMTAQTETIEIASVEPGRLVLARNAQQSWPVGSLVYPLRSAVLTDPPALTRKNDGLVTAQIRFRVTQHNSYSDTHGLPLYRGFPVLEPGANWRDDLTASYERLLIELDNGTGIPHITDAAGRAFGIQSHSWQAFSRAEQSALRRIFYHLRGRQRPIWLGSQSSDFYLISDIDGTMLDVEFSGFSDEGPTPGRQDIRIELASGAIHYRRIIAATQLSDTSERLAIDGERIQAAIGDVLKISFLALCRQNADSVIWQHKTDADGAATITANFRGVRDELE